MDVTLKHPSAWIPLALAGAAFVGVVLWSFGIIPSNSSVLYLFEAWIILEIFTVFFFALKWMPRKAHQAFRIILMHIACALIPVAIVCFAHA